MLDHAWIAAHIPHQGSMCLLAAVDGWSSEHIQCRAHSHREADNPLRASGRLGAACGIEYAAQAMAIHGALLAAGEPGRQGYLASVRSVVLHVDRLDHLADDLDVRAQRLSGDATTVLYGFQVLAGGQALLEGRATVVLDAAAVEGTSP